MSKVTKRCINHYFDYCLFCHFLVFHDLSDSIHLLGRNFADVWRIVFITTLDDDNLTENLLQPLHVIDTWLLLTMSTHLRQTVHRTRQTRQLEGVILICWTQGIVYEPWGRSAAPWKKNSGWLLTEMPIWNGDLFISAFYCILIVALKKHCFESRWNYLGFHCTCRSERSKQWRQMKISSYQC